MIVVVVLVVFWVGVAVLSTIAWQGHRRPYREARELRDRRRMVSRLLAGTVERP